MNTEGTVITEGVYSVNLQGFGRARILHVPSGDLIGTEVSRATATNLVRNVNQYDAEYLKRNRAEVEAGLIQAINCTDPNNVLPKLPTEAA